MTSATRFSGAWAAAKPGRRSAKKATMSAEIRDMTNASRPNPPKINTTRAALNGM